MMTGLTHRKWRMAVIGMVLAPAILLLSGMNTQAVSQDGRTGFQGLVMEVSLGDDYMIVNEMRVDITPDTTFWSKNRQPTSIAAIRKGQWVYIEALKTIDGQTAEKVYLIPHYIKGEEKDKYPFIP